jgi:hypothetical protein
MVTSVKKVLTEGCLRWHPQSFFSWCLRCSHTQHNLSSAGACDVPMHKGNGTVDDYDGYIMGFSQLKIFWAKSVLSKLKSSPCAPKTSH